MSKLTYVADTETLTYLENGRTRVWGWGLVEMWHRDVEIGATLDRLMELILEEDCNVYFHNIKFDGDFLLVWLYEHGYSLVKSSKKMPDYTFNTLISDKGVFYSLTIKTPKSRVVIKDSHKVLPFSVRDIGRGFGLDVLKGEIDYNKERPPGYMITDEEKEYIKHDVLIVCEALEHLHQEGLTKSTQASNALNDYKKIVTRKVFERWYPEQPLWKHDELASSYRGGFTYCNPRFAGRVIEEGIVLDKNSMYPWVMATKPLPVGEPVYFDGEYKYDSLYPLYIQRLKCQFDIKEDRIPTIQIKYPGPWSQVEYLTTSTVEKRNKKGEIVRIETEAILTLTNMDIKLFFEQYDVQNVEWLGGYKFRQSYGLFTEYINKWYKRKEQATIEKNKPQRQISKLMLNALYGKFGTSPHAKNKWPLYDNGKIKYVVDKEETEKSSIYVPIASFITSYAREECIRSAQACYERFLYADTDSLHLIGLEKPNLDIDPLRLGAWKCEGIFKRGKYIRSKTYVEEICGYWYDSEDGKFFDELSQDDINLVFESGTIPNAADHKLIVTCAGLPAACHDQVTFENFKPGAVYHGKLKPKHVPGGTILEEVDFTIKG